MAKKELVGGLITGFSLGAVVGYYSQNMGKPSISVTGTTWKYSGFPPNTALMSMGGGTGGIGSGPLNIGSTDANGEMVITGAPQIPPNNTVLYVVFSAVDPSIYAIMVLKT